VCYCDSVYRIQCLQSTKWLFHCVLPAGLSYPTLKTQRTVVKFICEALLSISERLESKFKYIVRGVDEIMPEGESKVQEDHLRLPRLALGDDSELKNLSVSSPNSQ
jgi:hypothetical protein